MGRLIDADICLNKAWQNFYKQEDEHEKNIEGYDILRDRVFEQSGFECCQQTIVNAPTVEVIPKDQYEARLKADLEAILKEISITIEEEREDCLKFSNCYEKFAIKAMAQRSQIVIKQKIDALKGVEDDDR